MSLCVVSAEDYQKYFKGTHMELVKTNAPAAPVVTAEQLELVKKTIAADATTDELKLYLYDCARQGVHPLDKLIHFTKRKGKYTPITSIDFMRIRAADTGEYAGNDDPVFTAGDERIHAPHTATVTVWRLVQGVRCPFVATARWDEYKPEQNDFMWRKMPHTMLGKCAEALALRKGFPRQLSGLYAKEEMDQAEEGPRVQTVVSAIPSTPAAIREDREKPAARPGGDQPGTVPDLEVDRPEGAYRVVDTGPGRSGAVGTITLDTGEALPTWKDDVFTLATAAKNSGAWVLVEQRRSKTGNPYITKMELADFTGPTDPIPDDVPEYDGPF